MKLLQKVPHKVQPNPNLDHDLDLMSYQIVAANFIHNLNKEGLNKETTQLLICTKHTCIIHH